MFFEFYFDRARGNSSPDQIQIDEDELSSLWAFLLAFIIGMSGMRFLWVSLGDVFQCGRFDTRDVREGKTTTSARRGEVVSNLQSLFQFAGLKQIRQGGWGRFSWITAKEC